MRKVKKKNRLLEPKTIHKTTVTSYIKCGYFCIGTLLQVDHNSLLGFEMSHPMQNVFRKTV